MTKPALITHDETVDVANTSYIIQGYGAPRINFIHASNDFIYNQANHDTLSLQGTLLATIYDQAQGTHISLDQSSLLTTILGFQNDHSGVIGLTTASFANMAAVAKSLTVIPGYGTELAAAVKGPIVAYFPGDYDVKLSQFHLHG